MITLDHSARSRLLSWEALKTLEHSFPYKFELSAAGKSLYYYGAGHVYDPAHPMIADLVSVMDSFVPRAIIIEGDARYLRSRDTSARHQSLAQAVKDVTLNELILRQGEPGVALYYAWHHTGTDLICAEPKIADEIGDLVTQGFSREHIFCHYLTRDIEQYHRMHRKPSFDEYIQGNLRSFNRDSNWDGFDCTLTHLQKIATEVWGAPLDYFDAESNRSRTWPIFGDYDTVINAISRRSSDFRDQNIVNEVIDLLPLGKVFVLYGGSHAVRQEPVLRDYFSKLS